MGNVQVALLAFKALPIYALQLANGLARQCKLHLFWADAAARNYSFLLDPEVNLHTFPTYRYRNPMGAFLSYRILRQVAQNQCRVLHLILSEPWFNIWIPFLRSLPLITTVHDVEYHVGDRRSSIIPQIVTDLATRYSSHIIVHGSRLKESVCRKFRIDPARVHVIPHINYSLYRRWQRPEIAVEPNNILFFGSIWKYKGLEYLIKSEKLLAQRLKDFKITIAGVGEDISPYLRLITDTRRYEIINRYIPDPLVAELFQRASIVVLPYIEASQSGVVPIAFSFGKPVVVTNVGSLPEIVNDRKDGLIVQPCDPTALADAITSILGDPGLRGEMARNALVKAETLLSPQVIGAQHVAAYISSMQASLAPAGRFEDAHRTHSSAKY